jgi:two-component system sensor histidine kinase ChvG
MTAEIESAWRRGDASIKERTRRTVRSAFDWLKRIPSWLAEHRPFRHGFSSLTRRIVVLNLIGLAILVSGILYLNQFRAGLIEAKVQSLLTQGEIIARAIAASAGVDTNEVQIDPETLLEKELGQTGQGDDDATFSNTLGFTIDPERAAPILRPLVKPTGSRARIYNRDGTLILDSDTF